MHGADVRNELLYLTSKPVREEGIKGKIT